MITKLYKNIPVTFSKNSTSIDGRVFTFEDIEDIFISSCEENNVLSLEDNYLEIAALREFLKKEFASFLNIEETVIESTMNILKTVQNATKISKLTKKIVALKRTAETDREIRILEELQSCFI